MLSSPINRLLKSGQPEEAIRLITEAKTPNDIMKDRKALQAKDLLKKERDSILGSCDVIPFNNLNVVLFYSKYRMQGEMASVIEGFNSTTTLAINTQSGRGSLRGELALYWKERLKPIKYLHIDGHPGFMGANIGKTNKETFVEDLTNLLQS